MVVVGALPVYDDWHHFPFATYGVERCALNWQEERTQDFIKADWSSFSPAYSWCKLCPFILLSDHGSAFGLLAGEKKYTSAIKKTKEHFSTVWKWCRRGVLFFPQKFRGRGIFRIRSLSCGQGCATQCSHTSALEQRWCGLIQLVFCFRISKKGEPSKCKYFA